MNVLTSEIKKLLKENPSLQINENGKKVKCLLSGHEMPCKPDILLSYISGKKYQRLSAQVNVEQYNEFLEPTKHKFRGNQLFCKLTLRHVNNLPNHIEQHVKGRRFLKAHKEWLRCKQEGIVFVPFARRNKRHIVDEGDNINSDNGAEGGESDTDSLQDFYPKNEESLESDSHDQKYDFDEIPAENNAYPTTQQNKPKKVSRKRKAARNTTPNVKRLKQKSKAL